eukprot:364927-Chlamydomonas_euryale.AAC.14
MDALAALQARPSCPDACQNVLDALQPVLSAGGAVDLAVAKSLARLHGPLVMGALKLASALLVACAADASLPAAQHAAVAEAALGALDVLRPALKTGGAELRVQRHVLGRRMQAAGQAGPALSVLREWQALQRRCRAAWLGAGKHIWLCRRAAGHAGRARVDTQPTCAAGATPPTAFARGHRCVQPPRLQNVREMVLAVQQRMLVSPCGISTTKCIRTPMSRKHVPGHTFLPALPPSPVARPEPA